MIREVEELRPELQIAHPAEPEVLEECDVPLLLSRLVNEVARGIPERAGCWCRECRRVEPEVVVETGTLGERRLADFRVADEVVGLTKSAVSDACDVIRAQHGQRGSGAQERRA